MKVYCGKRNPIPPEYDRVGEPFECLRKGVGVGLYVLRNNGCPRCVRSNYIPYISLSVICLLILLIFLLIWALHTSSHLSEEQDHYDEF